MDCATANGGTSSYSLDLMNPDTHAVPRVEARMAPTTRQPLTGDVSKYTSDQLIAMGYPPPPNPHSGLYDKWRRMVTTSAVMPHDDPVFSLREQNPHQGTFDNSTFNNYIWGGAGINQPSTEYWYGYTDFTVPTIVDDGIASYSSEWVGLGGENPDCALIQAGIEMDLGFVLINHVQWPIYTYSAWIEYFPGATQPVSGTVNPGDDIYVAVWASNQDGSANFAAPYGTFFIEDNTPNPPWYIQQPIQKPAGTSKCSNPVFHGQTAEWVVERKGTGDTCNPGPNQVVTGPLTDFGCWAHMIGEAENTSYSFRNFGPFRVSGGLQQATIG